MLDALLLGIIGGSIPGPILTAAFTEVLQHGYRRALRIILVTLAIETCIGILSVTLLIESNPPKELFIGLSLIGASVLLWLAPKLWSITTLDTSKLIHFSVRKIFVLTITNGLLWVFWATVCVPRAVELSHQISAGQYIFVLLFEIGWFFSSVLLTLAFARMRTVLSNPRVIPVVFKIFALLFVYFAVTMSIKSLSLLN